MIVNYLDELSCTLIILNILFQISVCGVISSFQCKMAPILRERGRAKEGGEKVNAAEKKEKPLLMNFKKQAHYRQRKAKAKSEVERNMVEAGKKALRSLRDRARYVIKKINTLKTKSKELKEEQKKVSKSKSMVLNIKIKKFRAEMELLKLELVNVREKISQSNA